MACLEDRRGKSKKNMAARLRFNMSLWFDRRLFSLRQISISFQLNKFACCSAVSPFLSTLTPFFFFSPSSASQYYLTSWHTQRALSNLTLWNIDIEKKMYRDQGKVVKMMNRRNMREVWKKKEDRVRECEKRYELSVVKDNRVWKVLPLLDALPSGLCDRECCRAPVKRGKMTGAISLLFSLWPVMMVACASVCVSVCRRGREKKNMRQTESKWEEALGV